MGFCKKENRANADAIITTESINLSKSPHPFGKGGMGDFSNLAGVNFIAIANGIANATIEDERKTTYHAPDQRQAFKLNSLISI